MTWAIPTWWQFVLLALAAYRLTRLAAWDVVTRPLRERVIGRYEEGSGREARDTERGRKTRTYHAKLDEFWHCPFCFGYWTSVALWLVWLWEPHWTLVAMTPFAINAVVGLVTKNWDA